MRHNIILTGFMGTGKTAVGRLLADILSYTYIDTDELIEERDGRNIPQIFAESGEAAFRAIEREVALDFLGQERLVISTGGGLMLDPVNAAAMERNGRVFCLTADVDTILTRLSRGDAAERPLLAGPNPKERIEALLAERQARYGQFTQIATDGKRPLEVAQMVLDLIEDSPND